MFKIFVERKVGVSGVQSIFPHSGSGQFSCVKTLEILGTKYLFLNIRKLVQKCIAAVYLVNTTT